MDPKHIVIKEMHCTTSGGILDTENENILLQVASFTIDLTIAFTNTLSYQL